MITKIQLAYVLMQEQSSIALLLKIMNYILMNYIIHLIINIDLYDIQTHHIHIVTDFSYNSVTI